MRTIIIYSHSSAKQELWVRFFQAKASKNLGFVKVLLVLDGLDECPSSLVGVDLDPSEWKLLHNVRHRLTMFGPEVAEAYKCAGCTMLTWSLRILLEDQLSYWERRLLAENILQCEVSPNPVLRVNSMVVGAGTNSVNGVMIAPQIETLLILISGLNAGTGSGSRMAANGSALMMEDGS